eukprot:5708347-Pleurochrysis_carterae.AAC.1
MLCKKLVRINSRRCVIVDRSGSPACVNSAGQRSTPQPPSSPPKWPPRRYDSEHDLSGAFADRK